MIFTARTSPAAQLARVRVRREAGAEPLRTSSRYLSWSIDISVFAGGNWWDGTARARRGMGTLPVPPQ